MSPRRIAVVAVSGAVLAGGAGAAIAAVTNNDGSKVEQAVLADAAKRLNVTPDQLHDALAAAQDAQLDQAVKDGKLTQQQADAIKARRKRSGRVLGGVGGGFGGRPGGPRGFGGWKGGPGHGPGPGFRGGPGFGFGGAMDLAKALGLTPQKLDTQLRAGKTIADIAKAQGKSLSDVRTTLKAATKTKLDQAVKDGKLAQARADKMRAAIDDAIDKLGTQPPFPRFRHPGGRPPRPPMPDTKPGAFTPQDPVAPLPTTGVHS